MDIGAGYTALTAAFEIAKGLKNIDDRVKLNAAVIELQEKILSAQEAATSAKEQMRDLQATIARFEDWEATAKRYRLTDFGEGTFAYELRAEAAEDEPPHLVCPNCFQNRKLSILQHRHKASGRRICDCPSCKVQYALGTYVAYRPTRSQRSDGW